MTSYRRSRRYPHSDAQIYSKTGCAHLAQLSSILRCLYALGSCPNLQTRAQPDIRMSYPHADSYHGMSSSPDRLPHAFATLMSRTHVVQCDNPQCLKRHRQHPTISPPAHLLGIRLLKQQYRHHSLRSSLATLTVRSFLLVQKPSTQTYTLSQAGVVRP